MSKTLQSPLFEKIYDYLIQNENKRIFLYVPYIKTKVLEKLLENIPNQIIIVTTWHINDLISGSSELKLYEFCKESNIALYINNKIHLKVYSVNLDSAIVASGNISHNGLMEGGNYEAGVLVDNLEVQDKLYLEKIKREAVFVDENVYQTYKEEYEKHKDVTSFDFEDPVIIPKKDYFLKSALPMTEKIDDLVQGYLKINSNLPPSENSEIANCIFHDLANYEIETGLSGSEFRQKLKVQFFEHPFTQKIDEFIENNERTQFGFIKRWVRDHCTDVPLPRPFEFTKNIQILYQWFVELGDGEYETFVYGNHTESLRKKNSFSTNSKIKKYEKEILEIISGKGKTINEIRKIYADIGHRPPKEEPSDPEELKYASKPVWHFKVELNNKIKKIVSEKLGKMLNDSEEKKVEKDIAYVIGKLEDSETVVFWYHESGYYSDGIWRFK